MSPTVRVRSRLSPTTTVLLAMLCMIASTRAQAQPTAHHPGQWTTPATPWPGRDFSVSNGVWAVHMALLRGDTLFARPHSQVLAWSNWSPTRPNAGGVWGWRLTTDDAAQAQLNLTPIAIQSPPPYDLFCAGHAALPDGDLLVISGTERGKTGEDQSARYESNTRLWLARQMHGRRWYGNATPTLVRDSAKILATAGNRGHHMVVFGGKRQSDGALTNDVRRYLVSNDGTWDPPVLDPTPGASGPEWPDAREFPSLTESRFDAYHLFGGRDAIGTRRDVWQLNRYVDQVEAQNWKPLIVSNPNAIPSRSRHVAVVTPDFPHSMYVFGGEEHVGGTTTTLNDFWQLLQLSTESWQWINRTAAAHANGVPSTPRSGHTAVYDRGTNRMFMFGGQDANGNVLNDPNLYVISFTNGVPSCQIAQLIGTGPAPRTRHAMALNQQAIGKGVLFGGLKLNGATSELSNELWEFTVTTGTPPLVTWTQRPASPAPAPRMDASIAVFTEFPVSYVVIGGELASGQWDSDVWEFRTDQLSQWQQHHPTDSPPALRGHRAISDEDILTEREAEIYTPETDQWSRFGDPKKRQSYHMIFHASDGALYSPGPNTWGKDSTWRFDPTTEEWSLYATNASTPLDAAVTGILYRPDQLMKASGPFNLGSQGLTNSLVTGAAAPATWRASVNTMARPRTDHTLNMLPTGEVIATGGTVSPGHVDPDPEHPEPRKRPELWDPTYVVSPTVVGYWYGDSVGVDSRLAPEPVTRGHHSSAVILPDGRILSGGGWDYHPLSVTRSVDQYSPPYLFQPELQGGAAAVRPQLLGAQDHITWGQSFKVACPEVVAAACLIRPGASTHAYNHDVRYVPLELDPNAPQDQHRVTLRFPSGSNYHTAPSGNYLLFVLKNDGGRMVPSVARWVNVSATQNPSPTYATWDIVPPQGINDLAVTAWASTTHTLQWTAPSDAGDGSSGKASRYELRYRIGSGIPTLDHFHQDQFAVSVPLPAPGAAGAPQSIVVTHASTTEPVFFRIISRDLAGSDRNWSTLSNEASTPQGGCPFVDTRTSAGWQVENSILGRSLTGTLSLDGYRLRHAPAVVNGRVQLRVRENEQERTTLDQIRLIAVDHDPGVRAWALDDQVVIGTTVPAARVITSTGVDITSRFSTTGEGFLGGPGDTLLVEFGYGENVGIGESDATQHHTPFHIDDGGKCPPDCGSPSPLHSPAAPLSSTAIDAQVLSRSGILIQRPDGLGGWRTVVTRHPRENADEAVFGGFGHGPVRLVFIGRHRVRSVGRVEPASGAWNATKLPLLSARHSRQGNVMAAMDTTGAGTSELVPGDTVSLEFSWIPPSEGQTRELLLLSHGVYTAIQPATMQEVLPETFAARPMRPNPFAANATIQFDLPANRLVRLEVLDAQGRRVRVVEREYAAGTHTLSWDGRNETGGRVGPGVYFYRFTAGEHRSQGSIALVP